MARSKTRKRGAPSGRLRIVAGKWRSRLLPVADEAGLRPTAARTRETLFNWLAPTIEGSRCLDLFAGTGALGLEALSRGAAKVTFVERSAVAARALRAAMAVLEAGNAEVIENDAFDYLAQTAPAPFDIVFLDPPFSAGRYEDLCRLLAAGRWLARGAVVYLEQPGDAPPPALPAGWRVDRSGRAGNVRFALLGTA